MLDLMTDASQAGARVPVPTVDPLVYEAVMQLTYLPVLLSGGHLEVHGREYVPPAGTPLIVACNHRSGLDPFVLARGLPPQSGRRIQFMAKQELFFPILGDIIRRGGSFPVDRDAKDVGSVRMALRVLQAGGTLGIFPEGSRAGGQLHGGVALMALKGRAPVMPAGLTRHGKRWVLRLGELLPYTLGARALMTQLEVEIERLSQPEFGQLWD
ncbi:1-acyl-sn-glycerol-3-phosphate acyltransferase [Deinococcus radiophilus]|uniref:1-acyl-sn-glycerol-3-phosphate acyltransferase n=3 Tax=Deinococcus radiophilus TaxID=32062 RepID=A0A3S0KF90_9DEIO|nr:1-acyl-sn-glycerol-3-phosphate acyltransferase [Deinococcus radiophilus]